jgi:hypothetical protein
VECWFLTNRRLLFWDMGNGRTDNAWERDQILVAYEHDGELQLTTVRRGGWAITKRGRGSRDSSATVTMRVHPAPSAKKLAMLPGSDPSKI